MSTICLKRRRFDGHPLFLCLPLGCLSSQSSQRRYQRARIQWCRCGPITRCMQAHTCFPLGQKAAAHPAPLPPAPSVSVGAHTSPSLPLPPLPPRSLFPLSLFCCVLFCVCLLSLRLGAPKLPCYNRRSKPSGLPDTRNLSAIWMILALGAQLGRSLRGYEVSLVTLSSVSGAPQILCLTRALHSGAIRLGCCCSQSKSCPFALLLETWKERKMRKEICRLK